MKISLDGRAYKLEENTEFIWTITEKQTLHAIDIGRQKMAVQSDLSPVSESFLYIFKERNNKLLLASESGEAFVTTLSNPLKDNLRIHC